ncbi:MAG: hypothetical protein HYW34_01635 [Candidatus Brennerbacteria bacterium]|nr:hypothetical protein [Candidatus Brennerbacteria bacterium]
MKNRPIVGEYKVPDVLSDKKGPFRLYSDSDKFPIWPYDPTDAWIRINPRHYSWFTAIRSRSPVCDKNVSLAAMNNLIVLCENYFESLKYEKNHDKNFVFEIIALISGLPVKLKTNSPHLYNFWHLNWYLGDFMEAEKRLGSSLITIRAAFGIKDENGDLLPIGAYFCPENRQIVFINTDYYGQCKSWALGAAGVGLSDFRIHSVHGACVEIDGVGILIIAPTGTGKSTYTNQLATYGFINSDDWVYIKEENGEFFAYPSERNIYVRSNAVQDDPLKGHSREAVMANPVMRRQFEIFEKSPAENVPIVNGMRIYERIANSRAMINPALLTPLAFKTPIKLVVLLRRDSVSPYKEELNVDDAIKVLSKGEYMIGPGVTDDQSKWNTLACESWYNPYLLAPNNQFETERFRALAEKGKARYVIFNTAGIYADKQLSDGSPDLEDLIKATTKEMLKYVSLFTKKNY